MIPAGRHREGQGPWQLDAELPAGPDCERAPADALPELPLSELPGRLVRASSGIGFIYEMLDLVASRHGLRDAALVIAHPALGRQVFRLHRGGWDRSLAALGPGLHAVPQVVCEDEGAYVTSLAELALQLDVVGHDARHDPLTGLLNRRSYEQELSTAMSATRRYGLPFALVLLDLDRFKAVNDRLGHAAGDAVLRALGAELRASLRRGDVAARLGGDEFALLVLNARSAEALVPLAQRLQLALDRAVPDAGIRFSTGVACFPDEADDLVALTRLADERLYAHKLALA